MLKYDIIIIGGGSGGYRSAELLSNAGKRVLIVEKEQAIGGVCLNYGCIPTKAYIAVIETIEHIKNAGKLGLDIDYTIKPDMNKILARKDRTVKMLNMGLLKTLNSAGITIINGIAEFINEYTIKVNDKTFEADHIIIATGSLDKDIEAVKRDREFILNSKDMLSLNSIPEKLSVIGAGVIGIELAFIFSNLGSKVTIIEYLNSVLPTLNNSIVSSAVEKILKSSGINVMLNKSVIKADKIDQKIILESGEEIKSDKILVATGRYPIIHESIKKIGIKMDNNGFIITDKRNRTNIKNIYAAGDVINGPMLAHKAYYDAMIIKNDIIGNGSDKDYTNIPYAIFTIPPVSHAGLTEEICIEKGMDYNVKEFSYAHNGRAAAYGARTGFVKMIISKDKNILGITVSGKESDLIIHEVLPLIYNKCKIDAIINTVHIHPTLSEMIAEML